MSDKPNALTLPRLIGDGMVLQRGTDNIIRGRAAAGSSVTVDFAGAHAETTAGDDRQWQITLPAMEAGGPYEMKISVPGTSDCLMLRDILLGDVWLCSGQSNMELTMDWIDDRYEKEIADCENSMIRAFNVPQDYDLVAAHGELDGGGWERVTPKSILHFSAIAYFFAKQLYDRYHIPVGIINASVGGTPIEAWMSEEALRPFTEYADSLKEWKDTEKVNRIIRAETAATAAWHRQLDQNDEGLAANPPYYDDRFDPAGWPAVTMPASWADAGLGAFYGSVWLRRTFEVPAQYAGVPARLYLGNIIHSDTVYINGAPAGSTPDQHHPRKYRIPAGLLRAGENTIIIRIVTTKGSGGFVKGKPFCLRFEDGALGLSGRWQYKIGAAMPLLEEPTYFFWKPTGLYNRMISPLLKTSFKGVAWYQGESSTKVAKRYEALFASLIADWRDRFGVKLPFVYVQLANFMESANTPTESDWAQLREAQRRCLRLPATGMAVAIDLGEWNDIHPADKKNVGYRLALAARAVAYGENNVRSGPNYAGSRINGGEIILDFTDIGSGLTTRSSGPLKGFAVAGADRRFVWADARIDGGSVVVWSADIPRPACVRYAWADNPDGANLCNREGLPASPFTTEP